MSASADERIIKGRLARRLRALGHKLKPVVRIGRAGLSETVVAAADAALAVHELIKVRFGEGFEAGVRESAPELAERVGARVAGVVGRTALLYRQAPEPRLLVDELPEGD